MSFTINFEHDMSESDATSYTGCASDFIYWNTDLIDFEMPVSVSPPNVFYLPVIKQSVPGCPIKCSARSAIFPTQTPDYVLSFDATSGQVAFSAQDLSLIGMSDIFDITCTSILSILQPDMRTIKDSAVISFIDAQDLVVTPELSSDGSIVYSSDSSSSSNFAEGEIVSSSGISCTNDRVMFLSDYTIVDYFISSAATVTTLEPSIMQYLPGCPVMCTLDEAQTGGVASTQIFDFDPSTGRVSIMTSNVDDAAAIEMSLTCTSTESLSFAASTTDSFVV
jgi:hypothetical protein